jgi:hypothetical protein
MAADTSAPPTLLFLVGPPAVGKMTVGREIARRTGLILSHNHRTIDLVLDFFPFGSPPFLRLVHAFRRGIFEEVAASDLPGMIFTYVWAYDHPSEQVTLDEYAEPFRRRGGRVLFAELAATQAERLRRSATPERLAEKPHMRDVEAAQRRLTDWDAQYRLSSAGEFEGRDDYLKLDNTGLSPAEAADRIIRQFALVAKAPDE